MADKIEKLHEKFKGLNTLELCKIYVQVSDVRPNPTLLKIIKTYIARSIAAEGIS